MAVNERQTRLVRLKQEPIDNWSTREKLALATAVQKIGNQNWGPVVRLLKPFAENDRPSDWFSPKFCALQYNDMFDKIEAPKRKRGERGEETTQDLIVKKYTMERLKELEQSIKGAFDEIVKVKSTIDKLKSKKYDEKFLQEVAEDIKKNEQKKLEDEAARQKWLAEREIKLSQISMKFRGVNSPRQVKMETSNVTAVPQPIEKISIDSKPVSETQQETVKPPVEPSLTISETKDSQQLESEIVAEKDGKVEEVVAEIKTEDVEIVEKEEENKIAPLVEKNPTGGDIETNEESSETTETVVDVEPSAATTSSKPESDVMISTTAVESQSTVSVQPETKNPEPSVSSTVQCSTDQQDQNEPDVTQTEDFKLENTIDISIEPDGSDDPKTSENIDLGDAQTPGGAKGGRRKRKKLSTGNSNTTIQTRSTRSSQVTVKTEPVDVVIPAAKEEAPQKPVTKKQRSNSIEEPVPSSPTPKPTAAVDSEESNAGPATPASGSETPSATGRSGATPSDVDANFKKTSMIIVRAVQNHRCAPILLKCQSESSQPEAFKDINSIKKRIENGQLHNNDEFKRDLMLMFFNAIMMTNDPQVVKILVESAKEILELFETSQPLKTRDRIHTMAEVNKRKTRGSGSKVNENDTPLSVRRTRKPATVLKSAQSIKKE